MFLIGLELNPKYLSDQLEVAILISHVSILVPFSLGTLLALLLYPLVSNASVSFTAFPLFLGAAMSITAFPVPSADYYREQFAGDAAENISVDLRGG